MFGRATITLGIGPHSSCFLCHFAVLSGAFIQVFQWTVMPIVGDVQNKQKVAFPNVGPAPEFAEAEQCEHSTGSTVV